MTIPQPINIYIYTRYHNVTYIQILTIDSSSININAALKIRKHFITIISLLFQERVEKATSKFHRCTFSPSHTDHPSIVWISRCPTQTFITQENDWIFYTNTRIRVGDLVWRIVDRESNDIFRYFELPPRDC